MNTGIARARTALFASFMAMTMIVGTAEPAQAATVNLLPGDDIQTAVDTNPPGTDFVLAAGVFRNQQVQPRDGQTFTGSGNRETTMTGAVVLTDWTRRRKGQWYATGQSQEGQVHGECEAGFSRCNRPEDLFVDGVASQHVNSRGQLGPGKWFFDYGADRIYIGEDPAGKLIETSVTRHAFFGDAVGVSISNLVIEKYASPAQFGAIDSRTSNIGSFGSDWTVDNIEGHSNHGAGVYLTSGGSLTNSHLHHNGQQALSATGAGLLIENNELSFNNVAGFRLDWEGGSSKFSNTTDLVYRGNQSHDNYGTGVWLDYENHNSIVEDNTVTWNYREGIYVEISQDTIVRNNYVEGNGLDDPRANSWLWSGGITVAASINVEVHDNTLVNNGNGITATQQNRGNGSSGPWLVQDLNVHHNDVTMFEGQTGIVQDVGDAAVFLSRNNHFEHNTYRGDGQALLFAWMDASHSFVDWREVYGHDWTGSFVSSTADAAAPVLTLIGPDPLMLEVDDPFTDPGATSTDNFDARDTVFSPATVDTTSTGTTVLTYSDTDLAGNAAVTITRTVIVGNGGPVLPEVSVIGASDGDEQGPTSGSFTLSRTGLTTDPLTVVFMLGGTASTIDYQPVAVTAIIAAGNSTASVDIIPIDDTDVEGPETVTLTLTPDPAYVVTQPIADTVTIVDNDVPSLTEVTAESETNVRGTMAGSYVDTAGSDDIYEALTEQVYAGGKRSRLEHHWVFDLGAGGPSLTFTVEAFRNGGPDEFRLEYSLDGSTWTPMVTASKTADDNLDQTYELPSNLTGLLTVRAIDTDRNRNEGTADTLTIDRMAIIIG